jgi:pimeloyl-ACP methyl ester carboxylesterase
VTESLQLRCHGPQNLPVLVYLPGLHGDWTLIPSFHAALENRVRFVDMTYPRTLEWSLEDYARAIAGALAERQLKRVWLLGESFGSQIVWPLTRVEPSLQIEGIVLANGFVRHPVPSGVRAAARLLAAAPQPSLRAFLALYQVYARFRHRHAPETLASVAEFIARRTEADRRAMVHRLDLIAAADPGPLAARLHQPVHYLAGLVDPIVPWPWVRAWLRQHCPGYRGGATVWGADHNVLATAPQAAAAHVLRWMQR